MTDFIEVTVTVERKILLTAGELGELVGRPGASAGELVSYVERAEAHHERVRGWADLLDAEERISLSARPVP